MDSKQMIESILKQINADLIVASHVENEMYMQRLTGQLIGWTIRSPVTWRVSTRYPGQSDNTDVFFEVLLKAKPDYEGAFQFPGTEDWVREHIAHLAITDKELSMPNLYQIIYDHVCAVGKEMANWRPGLVEFDNKAQLDHSVKHVWDEAKLTDSQIRDINNWLHGPVNEPPKLGFYGKHPPTENEADEPVVVEKKINFREFL